VSVEIPGASDQLDAARDALSGNFRIALVIIYLVLVAIFAHRDFPLLIMTAIPLGIASGIFGLALLSLAGGLLPRIRLMRLSQPFDMITMLGFLILMDTVVTTRSWWWSRHAGISGRRACRWWTPWWTRFSPACVPSPWRP
jgi:multidrug efflux pump subunit AcrB